MERSFQFAARLASAIACLIATLAIAGWLTGFEILTNFGDSYPHMAFNSGLSFLLCGFPLLFWGMEPSKGWQRTVYSLCGASVLLLGLVTLTEYLNDWNSGIDTLFYAQKNWSEPAASVERMAASSAVNMCLLGFSLLCFRAGRHRVCSQYLALAVGLQALLALLGYLFNVQALRDYGSYIAMSLPTAICFCLLSIALVFYQPTTGFVSILSSDGVAGAVARRLIPLVLLLPPALGFFRFQGERLGWFSSDLGVPILAVSHILIFSIFVFVILRRLASIERDRNAALEGQRKVAAEFESLFELSSVGQSQVDPGTGRFIRVNAQYSRITGYSRAELLQMTFPQLTHPEDREGDLAQFRRLIQGELKDRVGEKRYVRKDGQIVWVQLSAAVIRDSQGNLLSALATIQDITARKEAEEALAHENAALELERSRLRAVLEALPVGVFISDQSGRLIQANQASRNIWGGTAPLTSGPESYAADYRAWWPDGREVSSREWGLARALATGEACSGEEMEIETSQGVHKTILNYAIPIVQSDGQITGGVAVNVDITERKLAEQALNESSRLQDLRVQVAELLAKAGPDRPIEETLQTVTEIIVERMDVAFARIWTLDAGGTTLELKASAGMYKHLDGEHARVAVGEYKIGQVAKERRPLLTNQVIGDPHVHNQGWAKEHGLVAFAGYPLQVEAHFYGVIGLFSRRALSQNAFDALAAVAALLGQTLGRKKAELALQQSEEALRQQNERSQALAETTAQLLTAQNPAAMVHHIFARVAPVLKLDAYFNFMVSREGFELRLDSYHGIPDDQVQQIKRLHVGQGVCGTVAETRRSWVIGDIQNTPSPKLQVIRDLGLRSYACFPLQFEERLLGTLSFASRQANAFGEEDLVVMHALSNYVAIAQERANYLQELEQRVAERTLRLQETIGDLEHFSYSITHDMRAPLRAMQGFSRLLLGPMGEEPTVRRDFLTRIAEASERMDKLIRDALDYSKVARSELPLTTVDPDALLRSLIATHPDFQRPAAEIWIEGHLPPVFANEIGLVQCFSNLLANAVKFVPPNTRPRVKIRSETYHWRRTAPMASADSSPSAQKTRKRVRIWVEDNGIGIPKEAQERVFQIFQRLSKEYEGTGIGLALVRKVAERMGGKVGLESEPGKGSRFWVDLAGID